MKNLISIFVVVILCSFIMCKSEQPQPILEPKETIAPKKDFKFDRSGWVVVDGDLINPDDVEMYKKLKPKLANLGLTFCSARLELLEMEDKIIKDATRIYPDYGDGHAEYYQTHYEKGLKKWLKKYHLTDNEHTYISGIAMSICLDNL